MAQRLNGHANVNPEYRVLLFGEIGRGGINGYGVGSVGRYRNGERVSSFIVKNNC